MKRLDLYIGRTVMAGTLLAWLVVATLEGLFLLLGELGDVGRGDYTLGDALLFVLLSCCCRPLLAAAEVHEYELDNGLKLIVKEDHRAPA